MKCGDKPYRIDFLQQLAFSKRLLAWCVSLLMVFTVGCTKRVTTMPRQPTAGTSPDSRPKPIPPETESQPIVPEVKQQPPTPAAEAPNPPQNPKPTQVETTTVNPAPLPNTAQNILDEALDFCVLAQELWERGELEQALDALDYAYTLILKIDESFDEEALQQKEDLRYTISKRILEIYASRATALNGKYDAIPIQINKYVQQEISYFTTGKEKDFFKKAYQRSGKYRTRIEKALEKEGMPTELSWLPLIESGFKTNALSKARALGMWQFIPSTGYKFGLHRNQYVDERMDFEKSTVAAISYLKELHRLFGDWTTALAAYNCGEGRVLRLIRSQNVNYLDNFWDLYERLPRETARYVPRFLATIHILRNKKRFGLDTAPLSPQLSYERVNVSKLVHLKDIAKRIGTPLEVLKELNPELRIDVLPNETYSLKVPPGYTETVLAGMSDVPVYKPPAPPKPKYVYHKVKRGDTISGIAEKYGAGMKTIAKLNRLDRKYRIRVGQRIKVPSTTGKTYKNTKTTKKKIYKKTKPKIHTVARGDSLWNIARRYHTTVSRIKKINRLSGNRLQIGQKLKITGTYRASAQTASAKTYRVNKGDSPYSIAKKNGMPLERFLKINKMSPRSKIFPGQRVYVE